MDVKKSSIENMSLRWVKMVELKDTLYESYYAVPDKALYDYTVYVWIKYFTDYYN